MSMIDFGKTDLIVVGSGFFGATVAERMAELGNNVVLIEKRKHIGGNSFSENEAGIECHRYGPHIFHTNDEGVWNYMNQFTDFNNYKHQVVAIRDGEMYPIPINLTTINRFFSQAMRPAEAELFIELRRVYGAACDNLEQKAVSQIGLALYQAFIEGYSKKQWGHNPAELPASLIDRIPLRYDRMPYYFYDTHEGIPVDGYGQLFEKMLASDRIDVLMDTDFLTLRDAIPSDIPVVYTGPIDAYFDYSHGRLGWRTLAFERSIYTMDWYQPLAQINFPQEEIKYTRIHEYKHYTPENPAKDVTVVDMEYSKRTGECDDPYYPIRRDEDLHVYADYKEEASKLPNVIFGGRLGTYRYLNMDQTIREALDLCEDLK